MSAKKNYLFLLFFVVLIAFSYFYFTGKQLVYQEITSFEGCAKAGFHLLPTYPEQCKMPGKIFTNPQQTTEKAVIEKIATTTRQNYENLSYFIDGQVVTLNDGIGILPSNTLPRRATSTIMVTDYKMSIDMNADSLVDTIFLLKTTSSKENKSTYYLSSALALNTGYFGLNLVALDEDISLVSLMYKDSKITVKYTDAHSNKKTRYFKFENNFLQELN